MIGTGSVVIAHSNGWSACKDAVMGIEFDVRPDKTAKRTLVLSMTGLFDCSGNPKGEVRGLMKLDSGSKFTFSGNIIGRTRIELTGETDNDFETIFKEIKKWQEYYKGS